MLDGLDPRTRGQILIVPNRMARGSWGDYKPIAGALGVFEVALQFRWSNSLVIPAKPESSSVFWTPAFAGVTDYQPNHLKRNATGI